MKLNSLHVLLTYVCNLECDHCFVWGSPAQTGTFTLSQLEAVFRQALEVGTIEEFYFEGGEPLLYYPILVQALRRATELGFSTGIVSNGYWATNLEDALAWMRPLVDAGLDEMLVSSDIFHGGLHEPLEAHPAIVAGERLGLPTGAITIDPPTGYRNPDEFKPGDPVTGGGVMFRGRAAQALIQRMPRTPWDSFQECPYENLTDPGRVHLDPFGNLQVCQGIVMGNLFEESLQSILETYEPESHAIVGPLLKGGPAALIDNYGLDHEPGYVDACHLCYTARTALRDRFPTLLRPDQAYGVA